MRGALCLCLLVCLPVAAQQAPIPAATDLPGNPFFVKKAWPIGGAGSWDYLTMDPQAQRLYIAHGRQVQVVDVNSGSVMGEISGLYEAHQIALDDTGAYGYVSDGLADAVDVFDRASLQVVAFIPIHCSPRSIAFEPRSKLVFAVCGAYGLISRAPRAGERSSPQPFNGLSHIVVIDAQKNSVLADILVPGDFRFAQADGDGNVFVTVGATSQTYAAHQGNGPQSQDVNEAEPARIARLDAASIASEARRELDAHPDSRSSGPRHWNTTGSANSAASFLHFLPLGSACGNPQGLASDGQHQRLFVACDNQQFIVLDSSGGNVVASLTTGPGDDMLAYDADRGLIFIANGGGYGSLTIVQQDATTDSFNVIQNLPTMERARTVAVDSSTGQVYLVTDLHGVDLTRMGGIGTLRFDPIPGSFQVLVVGH
jgi:DNA-binding beta-propeller fold protein YncE